jgi:hypothetical protein
LGEALCAPAWAKHIGIRPTATAREYLKNTATHIESAERPSFEYRITVWNSAEGWAKFSFIRTRPWRNDLGGEAMAWMSGQLSREACDGRAVKWWFPGRYFGLHHKNRALEEWKRTHGPGRSRSGSGDSKRSESER